MKLQIKKGDSVEVIAGSDKGKRGSVLAIDKKRLKILVQGVRVQTHFDKQKGKFEKEGFVDYSNVKLVEKAQATAAKKTKKKTASAK